MSAELKLIRTSLYNHCLLKCINEATADMGFSFLYLILFGGIFSYTVAYLII